MIDAAVALQYTASVDCMPSMRPIAQGQASGRIVASKSQVVRTHFVNTGRAAEVPRDR